MIVESTDLLLIQEIASIRNRLRQREPERSESCSQFRNRQDRDSARLRELERTLADHAIASAITFDGIGGGLLHFTDHSPGSPSQGASFVLPCMDGLTMSAISGRLAIKRREFTPTPPAEISNPQLSAA